MTHDQIVALAARLRTKSKVHWIHHPGDTPEMRGHQPDSDCQEAAAELERLLTVERRYETLKGCFRWFYNMAHKAYYWEMLPIARLWGETIEEAIDLVELAKGKSCEQSEP